MLTIAEDTLDKVLVRSVPNIEKCTLIKPKNENDEPYLIVQGINFDAFYPHQNIIDINRIETNHSYALKSKYGVEAMRANIVKEILMVLPNIIHPSVPIGRSDEDNVEVEKYGEPLVPDFEIPYHAQIMESFAGLDLDAARKVAGSGFYYLMGDVARLHSAVISFARDFMIDRGFTYVIPPYMIRSEIVTGVMSFAEMEAMMYKIEGEDLYLIGTSEHSMIGKYIDTIVQESTLPHALTSYSPCFRKEKGAHGLEERGVYRIHQFEKQEMVVVCNPEDSEAWFDKLWSNTVDLFKAMEVPVRTLECCSGDLADLKVKSIKRSKISLSKAPWYFAPFFRRSKASFGVRSAG